MEDQRLAPTVGGGPVQESRSLFAERTRIERLGRIRQLVFGSLDGLLVPLGVISGVAGGTGDSKAVIVAGIAEAFAGALSMGAGEFISGRSEAQVQRAEVRKELDEMRNAPGPELNEFVQLIQHEGVAHEDAQRVAAILARYPRSYAKTMVEKELGIPIDPAMTRIPEAVTMGASYIIASVFPLVAYFFLPISAAFPVSLALTCVALIAIGVLKGKLASLNLVRSVAEVVLIGHVMESSLDGSHTLTIYR